MLFLSAQDINQLIVGLIDGHSLVQEKKAECDPEGFLAEIDKALAEWKTSFDQVDGVFVVKGPGSKTSLRVTVTIANTIGFVNKIPVVGLTNPDRVAAADLIATTKIKPPDKFKPLSPEYDRPAV